MPETDETSSPLRKVPVSPVLPIVNDSLSLQNAIDALQKGIGSVAIDAERASGYRYFQRAYLIQLFRTNSPIVLIDPIDLDLTPLQQFLNSTPWILHAATQDLPCLNELGLYPPELFDTELAAKLVGLPKVGLAALTESLLNVALAKEHSAVNWSIRPLEADWLNYAALDVELLPELKLELERLLKEFDRETWAEQEFSQLKQFKPNPPRPDQWRRTSGMHELPQRRQKAVVKHLWEARDAIAQQKDVSSGRLINDRAVIAIAKASSSGKLQKEDLRKYLRGQALEHIDLWFSALSTAQALPDELLPKSTKREDGIPHPKSWEELNPAAHLRWTHYRPAANELAEQLGISPEVLISPDSLRRYCWDDDIAKTKSEIEDKLLTVGGKVWATKLLAEKFEEVNLEFLK